VYRTWLPGQWVALCGAPEDLLLPDSGIPSFWEKSEKSMA
jgi:hypothetical protein